MCDYCSWIDQILARIRADTKVDKKKHQLHVDPVIIVHGGAGKIPQKERERMLLEVKNAATDAYSALINGRSAVDAVEKAISHMESQPFFNCAKGGSLDVNDEIVTDAAIMTVENAGCVGAVRDIRHPISLARKVLENTEHVLIVESGAQKFALDNGISIVPPGDLSSRDSVTSSYSGEHDKCAWADFIDKCDSHCVLKRSIEGESHRALPFDSENCDTTVLQVGAVGVIAFDRKRRLASGTSTAGEPRKPIGSISATGSVIGCGIYTNEHGCVSVSGNDTNIYCFAPARRIIRNLSRGAAISTAVNVVLNNFEEEIGECNIGAIALNAKGDPYVSFKCLHFPWAYCQQGFIYYGSAQNEKFREKVDVLERPLDCMCNSSDDD